MAKEKAYKLVAFQENISNSKAKELIDRGLVSVGGRKLTIARGEISDATIFKVQEPQITKVIFEDDDIIAVNKPAFETAESVAKSFPQAILLNRLDKETSGVMLFAKNEEFRRKAIKEFKQNKVYKEYVAIVEGKVAEEEVIDQPIITHKGKVARSKIDLELGKPAKTTIIPMFIEGNKSKIKVIIEHGRTHQIRVHLASIKLPIIGDAQYGKTSSHTNRMLLHSKKTEILGYTFEAKAPKDFNKFGLGA
ncbi:MAG: RNA pseudouridine synthase [Campylobacteraceae bacterium]|jgi:23S rRNA pseudouridine1911/1915/1917 synthase|nr:RNA pseudouridine synthase [Campylobacteraceae bacterium]MBT3882865.1 RNA pseudouridine synthase [Campylobacteraceae bacterium]MBT4030291.1 RNA pseudouridine synthase [Campylobacteraceae bacterium]MBT4179633.1 RNA pseudouridine synthase [Campylobacteraceae bacterium]MBT4572976.1 RNA pseudouridine synthase [Campylobacteraceae bacterium]